MADVSTTVLVTVVAGTWGMAGGFIYWALPDRPRGLVNFLKRVGVGFVSGALGFALGNISPFMASGAWSVDGVSRLVASGFIGLAGLASFLPESLNENQRKLKRELEALREGERRTA